MSVGAHQRERGSAYCVEDLADMPDDGRRYELVDGSLLVTPSPNVAHQAASGRLFVLLAAVVGPRYRVFFAPLDWKVSEHTLFAPDVLVVRDPDLTAPRLESPPVLAIEILSRSTRHIDRGTKRLAYAKAGLEHYWIFDPTVPSLQVFRLNPEGGVYDEVAVVEGDDEFRDDVFGALVVPAAIVA